jgi:aminopeptidase-like protein
MKQEQAQIEELFDRLFPICRSISGPGVRETLRILQDYIPLTVEGVPTGEQVHDWVIPKEWRIREAWIKDEFGNEIVNFRDSNLHVLNYSTAVDRKLTLEEMRPHLYSLPHLPGAIPYVTSYYTPRWGFCLPHSQLEKLNQGHYHVYIDSEHIEGELNYGHLILPGENKTEILITSYICHPSMANNELSGPIVAAFLYNRIKKWKSRRFTYRFVLAPETIGSIAYLSRYGAEMKKYLHAGFVLTCMGGQGSLSYKNSRHEIADVDLLAQHMFKEGRIEGRIRHFNPISGSDERQYGSPGYSLPVGQMTRMLDPGYEGYHNSLDTKEKMGIESLLRSVDEMEDILRALELDGFYINNNPYGEVKLDRHGLYPDMNHTPRIGHSDNTTIDQRTRLNAILMMLNYTDGQHTMRNIADRCRVNILDLAPIIELLLEKKLIAGPYTEKRGLFD